MQSFLTRLYHGSDRQARVFRYVMIVFDVTTLLSFVVFSFFPLTPGIIIFDAIIGVIILIDIIARLVIAPIKWRYLVHFYTLADIVTVASLLLPVLTESFAFLRILRALRLLRSYRTLQELRSEFPFFKDHERVIQSVTHLFVFIFVCTACVYSFQVRQNPDINNYADALYFTVTTLTTTGFGDITLVGSSGKLLAVLIMIFGISLFLRLVQTIFRPDKVNIECQKCGLARHDSDAIHCKHCGTIIHIDNDGRL